MLTRKDLKISMLSFSAFGSLRWVEVEVEEEEGKGAEFGGSFVLLSGGAGVEGARRLGALVFVALESGARVLPDQWELLVV